MRSCKRGRRARLRRASSRRTRRGAAAARPARTATARAPRAARTSRRRSAARPPRACRRRAAAGRARPARRRASARARAGARPPARRGRAGRRRSPPTPPREHEASTRNATVWCTVSIEASATYREDQTVVAEGKPAPDFELTTDAGETVKLSELRGKPVVLYFYPEGRHARLHDAGLRDPRLLPGLPRQGRRRARRQPRRRGLPRQVQGEVPLPFTLLADPDTRSPRPTASGRSARCTARSSWASSARPS